MVIEWTECFSSWVSTSQSYTWQDYDLYSNQGVPKGAIAVIALGWSSSSDSYARYGIRTDGSTLNRAVYFPYGTPGYSFATFYVKCHPDTGLIETFSVSDSPSAVTFNLLGYWTGVDFTETEMVLTTSGGEWITCEAKSIYGIPKNSVCAVLCGHHIDMYQEVYVGVRSYGSSIMRCIPLHGENIMQGIECITMCVKTDSDYGRFEYYSSGNNGYFMIQGYFGENMDYTQELVYIDNPYSVIGWNTIYMSEAPLNKVMDMFIMKGAVNYAQMQGCRNTDSSLNRYVNLKAFVYNGYAGLCVPTMSNSSGGVEVYVSDYNYPLCGRLGYFFDRGSSSRKKIFTCNII